MKQFFLHNIFESLLICFLLFLLVALPVKASEIYPFQPSSRLSSGTWVKVRIPETGIYEISYSELREMGFANPSKVGVYGKGGVALPSSFTDGNTPLLSDDLSPVGVWHHADKLYFYARSVEEIAFNPSSSAFERKSLNLYSLDGVYFLSDYTEPLLIPIGEKSEKSPTSYYLGFDYVYHEEDLFQNTTETGQIFWGENLMESTDGFKWPLTLPFIDVNAKAKLECRAYASDKSSGTLRYGVTQATSGNRSFNVKHPSPASGNKENPEFMHLTNPIISLSIPNTDVEVYAKVDNPQGSFINLDYWILTYGKILPDFSVSSQPQERFAITSKGTKPGKMTMATDSEIEVFDITDLGNISILAKESSGDSSSFYFGAPERYREFIFCDLSKRQKMISGYESVSNSDLHALASQGADFIIVTLPKYKDLAERLAELHRKYDGIQVIVATATEVYNEFSGGIPDPMAYRGLTKMCYEASEGRLKNLLLIGKIYGHFRYALSNYGNETYLIGFQDNRVTAETHAANAMDFYGFTDDFTYSSLQNNNMQVGVGLLPFDSEEEAEIYLHKVEKYLADEDKAEYAGELLSIGGVGDNHTHDTQAVQLAEYWNQYAPAGQNSEVLALDAFGEKAAKKKLTCALAEGKLLTSYFGHGTAQGINSSYDFFRANDIKNLKNEKSGFIFICACDLSDTDHGRKGFGELITTGTKHGMLGSAMATRTVWSGQNFELAKLFSSALYASPEKVQANDKPSVMRTMYRKKSPTIGEVFARSKTLSNYTNSLAYIYIGDPALTIPLPLRSISATSASKVAPGEVVRIRGTVSMQDSIHLKDTIPLESYKLPKDGEYNGKIVAKLSSKVKRVLSNDYITNTKENGKELYVPMSEGSYAIYNAKVKDGEFDFDITIPNSAEICQGDSLRLTLTAYDYKRDLAASGIVPIIITASTENKTFDHEPPKVTIGYDSTLERIEISVSDDKNLGADCLVAEIDGKPVNSSLLTLSSEGDNREYIIYTDNLSGGKHEMVIVAKDVASNMTEKSFEFEKSHPQPNIVLSADRKAVIDEIHFSLDREPNQPLTLVITDSNGATVYTTSLDKADFYWDCRDLLGKLVTPGLYKAFVKSDLSSADSQYSSKISFAIIE
ncbi:MAG: hypothetical protein K2H96_02135 [Muribaculaceae bacterium]|nr:hypothetical protein [Muribaculaceae bacterium]